MAKGRVEQGRWCRQGEARLRGERACEEGEQALCTGLWRSRQGVPSQRGVEVVLLDQALVRNLQTI